MSNLEKLKTCQSRGDLASLLGYKPRTLSYIVYMIPEDQRYTSFSIPKRTGGERPILSPIPRLKTLQRRLAKVLSLCAEEIFDKHTNSASNKKLSSLSHGFRKGHSIFTNATRHKRRRYVFNIDLDNFFPSINFGRVRGFFLKNNHFKLNEEVATVIAQIACYKNALPQGSPCSPIISNLISHILDIRLVQLAKKCKCTYSRYADDITFSTNAKTFPAPLAYMHDDTAGQWNVGLELTNFILKAGFQINIIKTRMQYNQSRQVVTGLIVNKKVNIRNEYYRYARAMSHSLFKTGKFLLSADKADGSLAQLVGIFSHIYNIKNAELLCTDQGQGKHKDDIPVFKILYANLLRYKYFHASEKPLIICEGKTDNIYLKCALRQLYPKKRGQLQFFNYSATTKDILTLSGGTGDFSRFISRYAYYMKKFTSPGKYHPVILLIDNDEGAKASFSVIKGITGAHRDDGMARYYYICDNLYLVPTPKREGKSTKIEDFFDRETLATVINGKTFNPDNTRSGDSNKYGKSVFAKHVVRKRQESIDFSNFKPIFERIAVVIKKHRETLKAKDL